MATGDVTISIAVEGGVTKTASFNSATLVKAKAYQSISTDADWQVYNVNKSTNTIVALANKQLESELSISAKSYTAAS